MFNKDEASILLSSITLEDLSGLDVKELDDLYHQIHDIMIDYLRACNTILALRDGREKQKNFLNEDQQELPFDPDTME